MIGKVEIVNLALARLGESPIQSLTEGTVPANMANVFYDPARRAALRDYNWNFAISTASLSRLVDGVAGFRFAFALPADCLRVIRIMGERDFSGSGGSYTLRSGKLCTDLEEVTIEYIRDVDDPSEFDDKFVEAFSCKLASDLAMPVRGSAELMANFANMYSALIARAAALSAHEDMAPGLVSENPYVEARVYGSY